MISAPAARVRPPARRIALLSITVLIAFWYLPGVTSASTLSVATSTLVFGLAAVGLGIAWGQAGQINLAHAAIFGVGSYAAVIVSREVELGLAPVLLISLVCGAVAGLVVGLPLARVEGHHFAILTYAAAMAIDTLIVRLHTVTGGYEGIALPTGALDPYGVNLRDGPTMFRVALVVALVVLLVLGLVLGTRWGDRVRAVRENAMLAAAVGVAIHRERMIALTVSGAVAGVAGGLYAHQARVIAPELFGPKVAILFIAVVLLGGPRRLLGGLAGAAVYFAIPQYLGLSPLVNQGVFGIVLVIAIILAPDGLIPLVSQGAADLKEWAKTLRGPSRSDASDPVSAGTEGRSTVRRAGSQTGSDVGAETSG